MRTTPARAGGGAVRGRRSARSGSGAAAGVERRYGVTDTSASVSRRHVPRMSQEAPEVWAWWQAAPRGGTLCPVWHRHAWSVHSCEAAASNPATRGPSVIQSATAATRRLSTRGC
jgi:hypothetical protein